MKIAIPGSFCSLLTLLFIGLKLSGSISWSWLLVLLPITWPFYLIAGIIVGELIYRAFEEIGAGWALALIVIGILLAECI